MGFPSSRMATDAVRDAVPDFIQEATSEQLHAEEGALTVMAKGLGTSIVMRSLVELHCDPCHLVFVLNTTKDEEQQLLHDLAMSGVSRLPAVINNECDANERAELYLAGGVLVVTSRILVVDLLSDRVPIEQTTGILVANAHRVSETSNVAFILRIVKQRNKRAFIKALSDDAPALTNGAWPPPPPPPPPPPLPTATCTRRQAVVALLAPQASRASRSSCARSTRADCTCGRASTWACPRSSTRRSRAWRS